MSVEARQILESERPAARADVEQLRLHRLGTITANFAARERERLALPWQPHGADFRRPAPPSEV